MTEAAWRRASSSAAAPSRIAWAKPWIAVSGVFRSCETLATKSRWARRPGVTRPTPPFKGRGRAPPLCRSAERDLAPGVAFGHALRRRHHFLQRAGHPTRDKEGQGDGGQECDGPGLQERQEQVFGQERQRAKG